MATTQTPQPKKAAPTKLFAKFPPFIVQPTGQVVTENPVEVEIDGWVQANIDSGLLIKAAP